MNRRRLSSAGVGPWRLDSSSDSSRRRACGDYVNFTGWPFLIDSLATGVFARIDHLLALLDRHFHRFFTQDMFAGFSRLEGMLGMESVGSDDIDDIDVRIVG